MAYSSAFLQRARELAIQVNGPEDALLVCKCMLENVSWTLTADLRKVIKNIDGLESELREVRMALNEMRLPSIASLLIANGSVSSINAILDDVKDAYSYIYAAAAIVDTGDNTSKSHHQVAQSLFSCQEAIDRALQWFISVSE